MFVLKANQPIRHRSDESDSLTIFFFRVITLMVIDVEVHDGEEGTVVKLIGLQKVTKSIY